MAGFIHNMLDIKLTILYLAAGLAGPVDFATLTDLALCDDGIDYFHFAEAVHQLEGTGHLSREGELYAITEKGRRDIADSEDSLSVVIRRRCDQSLLPVNDALRHAGQIRSTVEPAANGYRVRLVFGDGRDDLLTLALWTPDEDSAQQAAERFRRAPGELYDGVLALLLDGGEEA